MDNNQIRSEARQLLTGKWWMLALIWIIISLLSSLSPINLIIMGPLTLGISMVFLKIYRKEDFQLEEIFQGFNDFARSLTAYLLIALYVFLWGLLLIVPGIIAAISYSMTFFILAEDPKISATEAMRQSRQMMHGHKGEYFWLMLSFIGWFIVSCFTFGLGFLLLQSYVSMSSAIFYKRLKGEAAVEAEPAPQV